MKLPRAVRDLRGKTLNTSDDARRYVLAKLEARPATANPLLVFHRPAHGYVARPAFEGVDRALRPAPDPMGVIHRLPACWALRRLILLVMRSHLI